MSSPSLSSDMDVPGVVSAFLLPVQAVIIEALIYICLKFLNAPTRQQAALIVAVSTVVTVVPMAVICRYVILLKGVPLLVSVLAIVGQAAIMIIAQCKLLEERWRELPSAIAAAESALGRANNLTAPTDAGVVGAQPAQQRV